MSDTAIWPYGCIATTGIGPHASLAKQTSISRLRLTRNNVLQLHSSSALRFLHRHVRFQHADDVIELVHFERRKASLQVLDPLLGFDIGSVILLGLDAVAFGLPVLADHDERGG